MKQIATFVNEISDEFKVVVVKAIKSLCFKFPQKHSILMNFLSLMLREEGGLSYKTCIAETFINLIEEFPDAKECGLAHLCEFIEDCEHTNLAIKVLHVIGIHQPPYPIFEYNTRISHFFPIFQCFYWSLMATVSLCWPATNKITGKLSIIGTSFNQILDTMVVGIYLRQLVFDAGNRKT
jgi:hypothetical protein